MAEISNFQIPFVFNMILSRGFSKDKSSLAINQGLFLMYAGSEKVVYLHIHCI